MVASPLMLRCRRKRLMTCSDDWVLLFLAFRKRRLYVRPFSRGSRSELSMRSIWRYFRYPPISQRCQILVCMSIKDYLFPYV